MRAGVAGLLAGAAAGCLTVVTVAHASQPADWSGARIGTSSVSLAGCDATLDTIGTLRTAYRTTGDRYEIASVAVNSVPTRCRRAFRLTVVDNVTDGAALTDGVLTGTFSANNNTVTFTSGTGPQIQDLNNTNDQARVVVVVRGP